MLLDSGTHVLFFLKVDEMGWEGRGAEGRKRVDSSACSSPRNKNSSKVRTYFWSLNTNDSDI